MGEGRERREPKGSVTPKQRARHRKRKDAVGEREAEESRRQKGGDFNRSSLGLRMQESTMEKEREC